MVPDTSIPGFYDVDNLEGNGADTRLAGWGEGHSSCWDHSNGWHDAPKNWKMQALCKRNDDPNPDYVLSQQHMEFEDAAIYCDHISNDSATYRLAIFHDESEWRKALRMAGNYARCGVDEGCGGFFPATCSLFWLGGSYNETNQQWEWLNDDNPTGLSSFDAFLPNAADAITRDANTSRVRIAGIGPSHANCSPGGVVSEYGWYQADYVYKFQALCQKIE